MDEISLQEERLKKKHQKKFKDHQPPKGKNGLFTRLLLSIILVLISTIVSYSNETYKNILKQEIFETTLSFTSMNEWLTDRFGHSLPIPMPENVIPVQNEHNELENVTNYYDGIMASVKKDSTISALNSGIVVFLGEKENYGPCIIIQGIDGVDIWYGNITNIDLSMYDYVEKNHLLGSAIDNHVYFVIQKDGQYLNYEEYTSNI